MNILTNKWAYYNEIDPHAAEWIRNLIKAGLVAPGEVDERSIEDVCPGDVRNFIQCHWFAGIAVWSHALRSAGWSDDRPVWTGSCPCQPFSAAGKGAGFADERHLWPAFNHLIEQCKPDTVFGEQVASKDGLAWIDLVLSDLEAQGYAAGAVDTCAAGFGAPHIRQRLYWVADAQQHHRGRQAQPSDHGQPQADRPADWTGGCGGASGWLGDANGEHAGWNTRASDSQEVGCELRGCGDMSSASGSTVGLANADGNGSLDGINHQKRRRPGTASECGSAGWLADTLMQQRPDGQPGICHVDDTLGWVESSAATTGLFHDLRPGPTNGYWRAADWLGCRDDKWRAVEPGTFPLAHGVAARVVKLRAYGNAVNAIQAQSFVEAVMEAA